MLDTGFPKKDARFSKLKNIPHLLSDENDGKIMENGEMRSAAFSPTYSPLRFFLKGCNKRKLCIAVFEDSKYNRDEFVNRVESGKTSIRINF